MIHTFRIKEVHASLFGLVETDESQWRNRFATSTALTPIRIDSATIDMIARDLGKDGDSLSYTAWRYVNGRYPDEVDGFGGNLGDLGEVLAFLIYKKNGHDIVRVVSAVPGKKQAAGDRFPTPDFIIRENGNLAVLEVKSTQAFNYAKLQATKKWTWLQPCSFVKACRKEALPQLGYVGGKITQAHQLKLRGDKIVPFRAHKGIAVAVLAVDGRSSALRADKKYKTPGSCRPANECWTCLPPNCHFALVHMPNSPDMLALAGSPPEGSASWLHAYQRWAQALAARDLIAVRSTLAKFASAMTMWLDHRETAHAGALQGFWKRYLDRAMRARGLELPVPALGQHTDLADANAEINVEPLGETQAVELDIDALAEFMLEQPRGERASASATYYLGGTYAGTLTVRHTPNALEIELLSAIWQEERRVETPDEARRLIAHLLLFVARSTDPGLDSTDWQDFPLQELPLRELVATVGDQRVFLGWALGAERAIRYLSDHIGDTWLVRTWLHFWPRYAAHPDHFITVRPDGRVLLLAPMDRVRAGQMQFG